MLITPPSTSSSVEPNSRLKMTRNISGKAMVKKAARGFRQKAAFS